MKQKSASVEVVMLIFLFLFPSLLHAQPGFGDDVNDVPIDGGLSVLLAAGVGIGLKKLRKRPNVSEKEN